MEIAECIHGIDKATCTWCKPKGLSRAMRDARAARRYSWKAQYDGSCFVCGGDIEQGEYIRQNEEGGYRHVECP